MKRPDYRTLQALDAVIRERGFERAAQKLCITQSAVSQRIKQLENMFGQPLLVRTVPPRPTEQGQKLLALLRQVELLEDHAHLGSQGVHVHFRGVDARPFKEDVPLLDRLQTVQATDERALAGPGRPADDQHLALLDPLGNTFEHMELAVPFMDIPDFDQRHRFILSR